MPEFNPIWHGLSKKEKLLVLSVKYWGNFLHVSISQAGCQNVGILFSYHQKNIILESFNVNSAGKKSISKAQGYERFPFLWQISLKVAQWKNSFIKRPHNTANLNFPSPKLRIRLFLFFFIMETTKFLTTKYWLSWLPVTETLRRTVLYKVNKEWQKKKIQICCRVKFFFSSSSTEPPLRKFGIKFAS